VRGESDAQEQRVQDTTMRQASLPIIVMTAHSTHNISVERIEADGTLELRTKLLEEIAREHSVRPNTDGPRLKKKESSESPATGISPSQT